jgi:phosphoserine phosphatase
MPDLPPVLIIDLDGTLLSANSFSCWARFMLRAPFARRSRASRIRISVEVAAALAARRLRLIDHAALRSRLQRIWVRATTGDGGRALIAFLEELEAQIRPELRSMLAAIAAGEVDAVLATAALPDYVLPLGDRLGFRHVVAAPVPTGGEPGVPKRDGVRTLLRDAGWATRLSILLTDHMDDMPLARDCAEVIWFGDAAAERDLRTALPGVVIRRLVDASSVWASNRPSSV